MAYHRIASLSHQTFKQYANKHNLSLEIIDSGETYFAKMKLYNLLEKYDRLLFIDTDTIIRNDCPNLFEIVPENKFGAFDEHNMANSKEKEIHKKFMSEASKFYTLPIDNFKFFNTGVMVISQIHKQIFQKTEKYLNLDYYDQLLINLRLGYLNIDTQDIGYQFNRMPYVEDRVSGTRLDCYIIHYAGVPECYEVMKQDLDRWGL
jgi:lipopolysaccharide biosynthesis glycosyltransferase